MKIAYLFCIVLASVASPVLSEERSHTFEVPEDGLPGLRGIESEGDRHLARRCMRPGMRCPTRAPTMRPRKPPTKRPTMAPTKVPTKAPAKAPTKTPTKSPTKTPTKIPTETPTKIPTKTPTTAPTAFPTLDYCVGLARNGTHLYKRVENAVPWYEAYFLSSTYTCCGVKGHLVTISNAAENAFVKEVAAGNKTWIGYTDHLEQKNFVWIDGTPSTFANFKPGEPTDDEGVEDCVELDDVGWNDARCFWLSPSIYIIEFDCA
jgi:Lectin C-type domain